MNTFMHIAQCHQDFFSSIYFSYQPVPLQKSKGRCNTQKLHQSTKIVQECLITLRVIQFQFIFSDSTLFEYLDLLTDENTKFSYQQINRESSNSSKQLNRKTQGSESDLIRQNLHNRIKKQNINQYHQQQREQPEREFSGILNKILKICIDAVICDCYVCFCEGCPWQITSENKCVSTLKSLEQKFLQWFFENQKLVALFTIKIGSFIYIPCNNLFYFSQSYSGTIIGGIIFRPLQFFVELFTISFLTTRREMVGLEKHNQIQRALLMYYHLRKAMIFTIIFAFLIATITYLLAKDMNYMDNPFEKFNCYFSLIQNICLVLFIKFYNCLSNNVISDDDRILKAQSRLYAMQSNLIKYFPSDEVWLENIEQKITIMESENSFIRLDKQNQKNEEILHYLESVMKSKCFRASNTLFYQIKAIDNQKFKKIKKNLGQKRFEMSSLPILLYLNCLVYIVFNFLDVFSHFNTTQIYIQQFQQKVQENNFLFQQIYMIQNIIEFTLIPYLIGVTVDKISFFGQDYGQILKNQQADSLLDSEQRDLLSLQQ